MALVKYGGGIVQMSGSIAGTVFARNKSGNYARPRTKPVNPKSPRQEAARTVISDLAQWWHEELDNTERGLWENYAAAVAMKNKLGETIHLSGFNHFLRSNAVRLKIGGEIYPSGPTTLSLAEKDEDLVCTEESLAAQTFTFTFNDTGWGAGEEDKKGLLLYMGKPQLISRQSYHGPFRYMDHVDPTEGVAGTGDYASPYSFALGQKVWFRARMHLEGARTSTLWQLDPRDIVADV